MREIAVGRTSRIRGPVLQTGKPPRVGIDPGQTVAGQQMRNLIPAADGRFVLAAEAGSPGKTNGRGEVIFVARPDSLFRILTVLANQNDFSQARLRDAAVMESFIEVASRNSEVSRIAANRTARPVRAGPTAKIRHSEQVPTNAEVERE